MQELILKNEKYIKAKDILINNCIGTSEEWITFKEVEKIMIKFAKLHCIEQAKVVLEKTEICLYQNKEDLEIVSNKVDHLLNETNFKDSILNGYNLNNIK